MFLWRELRLAEYKVQFFADERFEFGDRICYGCLQIGVWKVVSIFLTVDHNFVESCLFWERTEKALPTCVTNRGMEYRRRDLCKMQTLFRWRKTEPIGWMKKVITPYFYESIQKVWLTSPVFNSGLLRT